MKIYNTLSGKKEEFVPITEGKVNMYICGPTVYNYVHIGNMRPVITFDMVYNYFKYLGYDVKYASNFTDINEKISIAAKELGITEREVVHRNLVTTLYVYLIVLCESLTVYQIVPVGVVVELIVVYIVLVGTQEREIAVCVNIHCSYHSKCHCKK